MSGTDFGFLKQIKGLILDMDGVLWQDTLPLLDLPAFFHAMDARAIRYVLATNNATRSALQYQQKIAAFGVNLNTRLIINSSMAAAYLLKARFPTGGSVFVVGETGLVDTLAEQGFTHSTNSPLAVVAGLDRTLSYDKLTTAALLIRAGTPFIGTNPDLTYPTPAGQTPGSGSVLAFLEAASGVKPVIAGKPKPFLFELALERLQLAPEQVLAVGDRLDTDIAGGQAAGCRTAAVLSGVSTLQACQNWQPPIDLILNNLADLTDLLHT